ncbi:hypothetical protein Tco_1102602 [Tanacetum coccineum]
MPPTNNRSTEDVPPPVIPVVNHESISEPANAPVINEPPEVELKDLPPHLEYAFLEDNNDKFARHNSKRYKG